MSQAGFVDTGPRTAVGAFGFNVLFWLGFWLAPVVVLAVEQWPELSLDECLRWLKQGIVFTAGMSALAEVFGQRRRFFYLAAGLIVWGGAVISIVFIAATGITENAFTALTGIVYSASDGPGLRYLVVNTRDLLGIVAASCPFLLLIWRWRTLDWRSSWKGAALAASLCVVVTLLRLLWHDYGGGRVDGAGKLNTLGSILDPSSAIAAYVGLGRTLPLARELMLAPDRPGPVIQMTARQHALTIIVVVGESTARNHMSLYGYCRDTTPALNDNAANLFAFRNFISEVPLTVFALSNGFRVALDGRHGHPDQSVFDVFNAAAFHTYWLSNQFDYPGDPVSSLTHRAQYQFTTYRAKENGARWGNTLDDALLAPLDAVMAGDTASKLILLHTVGTHSHYEDRVPAGFLSSAFQNDSLNRDAAKRKIIDAYDRAVRYVDFILGEVIGRAKSQGGEVAVVYFSDHGDEVFGDIDFLGHRYPRATQSMVEIPVVVWLSPELRADQPAVVDELNAALSQKMDLRDMSALLLDIAGIGVEGLSEQRRPLGGKFLPHNRLVEHIDYDQDPSLGITRRLPKLVCH